MPDFVWVDKLMAKESEWECDDYKPVLLCEDGNLLSAKYFLILPFLSKELEAA